MPCYHWSPTLRPHGSIWRKWYPLMALALCLPAAWWVCSTSGFQNSYCDTPNRRDLADARRGTCGQHTVGEVRVDPRGILTRVQDPIQGSLTIRLQLVDRIPLILDFAQPASHVSSISANGHPMRVQSQQGHLVVPVDALRAGENTVDISFTAGNEPLNRNDDYLYSLFVPARASQAFPCFDQPDIKGSLALTLEIPVRLGGRGERSGNRTQSERRSHDGSICADKGAAHLPLRLCRREVRSRAGRT